MEEKKVHHFCLRCGRRLRSDEARERGMGKVCWEKSQPTNPLRVLWDMRGKKDELPEDN